MKWIKPATDSSMKSLEEMVEYMKSLVEDRGIAITTKPTKIMYRPSDLEDAAGSAKREWVGLTDEEAAECWTSSAVTTWKNIEAKLREKNGG